MVEDARKVVREMFSLCGEINKLDREMDEIVFGSSECRSPNKALNTDAQKTRAG